MATQSLSEQATHDNTPAIPDEDGVFEGQEELFCLIPALTMEEAARRLAPPPKPLDVRKELKRRFTRFRDRLYAKQYAGTTGKLANGVTWRLSLPRPEQEAYRFHIEYGYLNLDFDDHRVKGISAPAFMQVHDDKEQRYRDQLKEFARLLRIRQLVPAEPGDPLGFYVMWECDAKRRQQAKDGKAP